MIASLMMYARPELDAAHARYWSLIRDRLAARGITSPEEMSNDKNPFAVWTAPDLLFSQTCGMPYRLHLRDQVQLVGTPDYGLNGCAPGYYRSAIVVRQDNPRQSLADFAAARFAYNETGSQSGYAAPYATAQAAGFWFHDRVQSSGHRLSAEMVADGSADIAALDAMTWKLIQRYDAFADSLRVLTWTEPTPGLPYITGPDQNAQEIRAAVSEAIAALTPEDREALCLRDLVTIPDETYLAIPNPPAGT